MALDGGVRDAETNKSFWSRSGRQAAQEAGCAYFFRVLSQAYSAFICTSVWMPVCGGIIADLPRLVLPSLMTFLMAAPVRSDQIGWGREVGRLGLIAPAAAPSPGPWH